MKKIWVAAVILGIVSSFSAPVMAENFAFVDMQKVFMGYKEAKKGEDEFQKKRKDYDAKMEEWQKKIDKAKADKKSDTELANINKDMEKEMQPLQDDLVKFNSQTTAKLQDNVLNAIQKVAKEYDVDVVLSKQASLYGGFEITDFVIEALNASK